MEDLINMLSPRYNKRVRGAISILLLILFTPFVTIAFVMLELGRYENTILEMDQAMGLSTTSVLANYDKYLHERFGFLAVSQNEDMNTLYNMYMTENSEAMRSYITKINSYNVTGVYSLANMDVFVNQIDEYMFLSAPTTFLSEIGNLSDILETLGDLSGLNKMIDMLNGYSEKLNSTTTTLNSVQNLVSSAEEIEGLIEDYNNQYNSFYDSVEDLINEKKNTPTPLPSGAATPSVDPQKAHDDAVATLATIAANKRDEYSGTIAQLITQLTDFQTTITELTGALDTLGGGDGSTNDYPGNTNQAEEDELLERIKGLPTDSPEYQDLLKQWQKLKNEDAVNELTHDFSGLGVSVGDIFSDCGQGLANVSLTTAIQSLIDINDNVKAIDINQLNDSLDKAASHYGPIEGFITADAINDMFLNQATKLADGAFRTFLKNMGKFLQIFCGKQTGIIDPSKDANINIEYYLDKINSMNFGDVTLSTIINDFITVVEDVVKIEDDIEDDFPLHPIRLIVDFVTNVIKLIGDVISLFRHVDQFFGSVIDNFLFALTNPRSVINEAIYATYNMNSRTDEPLIGKMNSKAFATPGAIAGAGIPFLSEFAAILDSSLIHNSLPGFTPSGFKISRGDDLNFVACELEYILFGLPTEIANQACAFLTIYYIRLFLDGISCLMDQEFMQIFNELSAATAEVGGAGGPIYAIIVILCEPLIDALVLVNGEEEPFLKTTHYFTYSGLMSLISDLTTISMPDDVRELLIGDAFDAFNVAQNATGEHYTENALDSSKHVEADSVSPGSFIWGMWGETLFSYGYRDYLFLVTAYMCSYMPSLVYSRIADIVKMEENQYYYNKLGKEDAFYLDKAYTMIKAETQVGFNPVFATAYDNSLLTIDRAIYRGY